MALANLVLRAPSPAPGSRTFLAAQPGWGFSRLSGSCTPWFLAWIENVALLLLTAFKGNEPQQGLHLLPIAEHLLIYSFIQQIAIEFLLGGWHCTQSYGCNSESGRHSPALPIGARRGLGSQPAGLRIHHLLAPWLWCVFDLSKANFSPVKWR